MVEALRAAQPSKNHIIMIGDMLTGGKLYGEGAYGCVFARPALKCKGKGDGNGAAKAKADAKANAKDTVATKLMDKTKAAEEMAIADRIRAIPLWKNYFIVATDSCVPAREQPKATGITDCDLVEDIEYPDMRILKMAFGGTSLSTYKFNFHKHSFLEFSKSILEATAMMTLFGIVHRDLHRGNILLDDDAVPRIIDFGLALNVNQKQSQAALFHRTHDVKYAQEPPDYTLTNAVAIGMDAGEAIADIIKNKKILGVISSTLTISEAQMERSLRAFYNVSPAAQTGDLVGWFEHYWSKIDSWSAGVLITYTLSNLMLWKSFMEGEFSTYSEKLFKVLRGMCDLNPGRRLDAVEALAELDPENYVIKKWGAAWLAKRSTKL